MIFKTARLDDFLLKSCYNIHKHMHSTHTLLNLFLLFLLLLIILLLPPPPPPPLCTHSDVVVQIVDARNPLLFRCEDLEAYVTEAGPSKKNILLLNKADLLTPEQR